MAKLNPNGLNDKQQRFVDEYLIDSNGKQAAIRAGYSPASAEFQGSKLLADSKVSQAIKNQQVTLQTELKINKEDLLRDLQDIKDAQKSGNPQAAIKAIEVMSKMLGLFAPEKIEHSGNQPITVIKITEVRKDEE